MDADQFIDSFEFSSANGFATDDDVRRIEDFLRDNQQSARLLNFCGNVIQYSDTDPGSFTLDDARKYYEAAIDRFPADAEGYESLGHWHDVYGRLQNAEKYFKLAIERTTSDKPKLGLARVLAELGRKEDGLAVLADCLDQSSIAMRGLRDEIEAGDWTPDD